MIQVPIPADSLHSVLRKVLDTAPYQWQAESDATVLLRAWWNRLIEQLDRLAGNHPMVFRLLLWGLVALLAAMAVQAIWILIRTTRRSAGPGRTDLAKGSAIVRNALWYGEEAERLFREGRYAAAMQADFVRLVLELDARNRVRFHPSKTPLEYLAEVPPEARDEFGGLVGDLYRYAFAGVPCGADQFAAWRRLASVDRYVAPA